MKRQTKMLTYNEILFSFTRFEAFSNFRCWQKSNFLFFWVFTIFSCNDYSMFHEGCVMSHKEWIRYCSFIAWKQKYKKYKQFSELNQQITSKCYLIHTYYYIMWSRFIVYLCIIYICILHIVFSTISQYLF